MRRSALPGGVTTDRDHFMTIIYKDASEKKRTATNCRRSRIPNFWQGTRDDGKAVTFHESSIVKVIGKGEK